MNDSGKSEIKFFTTKREQESLNNEATLFSNLTQLDYLEKINLKAPLSEATYLDTCKKLIAKCKAAFTLVKTEGFNSIEEFCQKYQIKYPLALARIKDGKPLTSMTESGSSQKNVADIVCLFITLTDKLRLSFHSTDELYQSLRQLKTALEGFSPVNEEINNRVKKWWDKISVMGATENLDKESANQFLFDLENSLTLFYEILDQC